MNINNTTLLVALAATYGFIFGFGYGNLFDTQYGFRMQDWQTTGSVLVALLAAVAAYFGVQRTLKINVMTKEQDRLDESLPGLREVEELMLVIRAPLRSLSTQGLYQVKVLLDSALNIKSGDSLEAAVHRRLPLANHHLKKEVVDLLFELWSQGALLEVGKTEVDKCHADLANIHLFAKDSHDGLREIAQRVDASHKRESAQMRVLIASLDTYAGTIKERVTEAEQRLRAIRRVIDKFFKEDA